MIPYGFLFFMGDISDTVEAGFSPDKIWIGFIGGDEPLEQ